MGVVVIVENSYDVFQPPTRKDKISRKRGKGIGTQEANGLLEMLLVAFKKTPRWTSENRKLPLRVIPSLDPVAED